MNLGCYWQKISQPDPLTGTMEFESQHIREQQAHAIMQLRNEYSTFGTVDTYGILFVQDILCTQVYVHIQSTDINMAS